MVSTLGKRIGHAREPEVDHCRNTVLLPAKRTCQFRYSVSTVEVETLSRSGFETAGTLVKLRADHGDTVKADTSLARPDT
jgi:hypothetical protein